MALRLKRSDTPDGGTNFLSVIVISFSATVESLNRFRMQGEHRLEKQRQSPSTGTPSPGQIK